MKNIVLSMIGVMGLVAGCCHQKDDHWAGVCDCDPRTWSCRTGPGTGTDALIHVNHNVASEEIKEAPKEMPK